MGTWVPPVVRGNDAWPASFASRDHLIGERTFNDIPASSDKLSAAIVARDLAREASDPFLGAVLRHVAEDETTSSEAESLAAFAALADANVAPEDVDVILGYAIVPDRLAPLSGPAMAHRIGARRALAVTVDTTCASAITQLEIARAYVQSGLARVVLLVQSHLLLRTMALEHPASPGLGDGASALVVAADRPGLLVRSTFGVTHGEEALTVTWIRAMDAISDVPWWKSGGDFRLGSRRIKRVKNLMRDTVTYGADTIRAAANVASVDVKELAAIASVQPRGFLPCAIAERLGLPRERAVTTYERVAHLGACGPVFNLVEARARGLLRPGACVAMYGQGAGFTRAAAILESN
jgi:3-oxoacyl-[acyl-carrier-protein] synthase-3